MPFPEMPKKGEQTIDIIRKICDENGIDINELFREAKEPVCTIQNWKKSEPQTLLKLANLKSTLSSMIKEKKKPKKV